MSTVFNTLKAHLSPSYHYKRVTLTFTVEMDKDKLSKTIAGVANDRDLFYNLGENADANDIKLVNWIERKE